jgi:hypothetical protein
MRQAHNNQWFIWIRYMYVITHQLDFFSGGRFWEELPHHQPSCFVRKSSQIFGPWTLDPSSVNLRGSRLQFTPAGLSATSWRRGARSFTAILVHVWNFSRENDDDQPSNWWWSSIKFWGPIRPGKIPMWKTCLNMSTSSPFVVDPCSYPKNFIYGLLFAGKNHGQQSNFGVTMKYSNKNPFLCLKNV